MLTTGTSQLQAAAGSAFTDALTSDIAVRMTARGPQDTAVHTGQDTHGATSPSESAGR